MLLAVGLTACGGDATADYAGTYQAETRDSVITLVLEEDGVARYVSVTKKSGIDYPSETEWRVEGDEIVLGGTDDWKTYTAPASTSGTLVFAGGNWGTRAFTKTG